MSLKYRIAIYTGQGTREINEDYVTFREYENGLILIVADGLGGHQKGEVASKHVSQYIEKNFCFEADFYEEELGRVIEGAQRSLLELQKTEKAVDAMKTTAVVLAIRDNKAFLAHVGDSRGYVFDRHKKYIRTLDHSVPQMLAMSGDIREKDIRYHSDRSSLLRVLGSAWEKDAFDVTDEIDTEKVKAFLLVSDGFWELIEEKEMIHCLKKSKTPKEWIESMAEIVEKNGKGKEMDNFTAGAVFVCEE